MFLDCDKETVFMLYNSLIPRKAMQKCLWVML